MKIYFDLDDVGNELSRFLIKHYNEEHGENYNWHENENFMIGENPKIKVGNEYFTEVLHREGTFFNLEPASGFVDCMKRLIEEGYEVRIITHPQWTSNYCLVEKIEWIKKHLPFFDLNHLIMTRLKGEVAGEGRILLDDSPGNLKAWQDNGGIAVSYAKIAYSQKWEGLKVKNFNEFYELVKKIESKQK